MQATLTVEEVYRPVGRTNRQQENNASYDTTMKLILLFNDVPLAQRQPWEMLGSSVNSRHKSRSSMLLGSGFQASVTGFNSLWELMCIRPTGKLTSIYLNVKAGPIHKL